MPKFQVLRSLGLCGLLYLPFLQACGVDLEVGSRAVAEERSQVASVENECKVLDSSATISREELKRLMHIAPGNTADGMVAWLGKPYCHANSVGYYPIAEDPNGTWVGIDCTGAVYRGYRFSANNTVLN